MAMIGQGVVLMVAGMAIVYLFLWVMIVVVKYSSRLERRFAYILPDDEPKAKRKVGVPVASQTTVAAAPASASGTEVKAPVPGSVLRLSASNGQQVHAGDEILVMDVMKMETPISAPCDGTVTIRVAATDKVATGDVVAIVA